MGRPVMVLRDQRRINTPSRRSNSGLNLSTAKGSDVKRRPLKRPSYLAGIRLTTMT